MIAFVMFLVFSVLNLPTSYERQGSGENLTNTLCPVLTDEKIDLAIFTVYKDRRVYFCCNKCRKKFLADPEAYAAHLTLSPVAAQKTSEAQEEHSHEHGHDHAADHDKPEGLQRFVRYVGKFHPLVVHFPIALIFVAALAELLFLRTRRQFFTDAARFSIGLGAIAALAAASLGWAAGHFAHYPGELATALETHRWLGTGTAFLATAAVFFSEMYRRRSSVLSYKAYRILLFSAAVLVSLAGHFGATLIYGLEYYEW